MLQFRNIYFKEFSYIGDAYVQVFAFLNVTDTFFVKYNSAFIFCLGFS